MISRYQLSSWYRAKPPLAVRKPSQGPGELLGVKVGPQDVGEVQLSIGHLPEQEVADARLAAGADEQVHLGHAGGAEVLSQVWLGEVLGTGAGVGQGPPLHGLHDVPAPAVVGRDVEGDGVVVHGGVLRHFDTLLQLLREGADVTQHLQAHALGLHGLHFFFKELHEQTHEGGHLVAGAAPVFGAEGKEGEVAHALVGAGFDQVTHACRALGVADGARHVALFGPAAVAVHDDGDVARDVDGGRNVDAVHRANY